MSCTNCALLAGGVASVITLVELITSKYPHTYPWLWRCWPLWLYVAIYGVIAFGLMFGVDYLISSRQITLQGLLIDSPWVQAIAIGITTKALMQITFFNVGGLNPTPIGIASITQIFEPWLLERLQITVWIAVRESVQPHSRKFPDVQKVVEMIENKVPPSWSKEKSATVLAEMKALATSEEVMYLLVNYSGREMLQHVFPLD